MFQYNDPKFKSRRRDLRKRKTTEEKILWSKLRGRNIGYKFFRQYSIGPYILDFYCPKQRLGIELDGKQHKSNKEYDKLRDGYLVLHDIKVLRFWNKEINANIDNVLSKIVQKLASSYVRGGWEELK